MITPFQAVDDIDCNRKASDRVRKQQCTQHISECESQTLELQQHESLVTESTTLEVNLNTDVKALDAGLVITESSRTKSDKHDTSSNLRTYITHDVDAEYQTREGENDHDAEHDCKINELKAQLQSQKLKRSTTFEVTNKKVHEKSKVKNDIDVIETINIELEHSVAKLLAANEQLHKENEHLKQTYKELFDSIKKTKVQNKDNSESLISQINQKSVENADLKAQFQEEVFANAALKNELRKIKGNSVDTKFAKASILGKPPLQPSRNHLVVRQPNAFTSERPIISRPRFASKVDEKNDLSKTVTPQYLPIVRESAAAKPHQVNAPNYSRNSHKESYGSNDMVHAYFLEDARKMTQDKTRIPNHRDMASTGAHYTPNACSPKPRNIYRSSPVSKCSGGMSNGEPLVDHSRNSSFFLDSKKFVCLICHKCIFNANHDDCITKILKKVNSRAKVQSPMIRNNKPVEPKNHTHKPDLIAKIPSAAWPRSSRIMNPEKVQRDKSEIKREQAQPPSKISSKFQETTESDAICSKQHPALTSTGCRSQTQEYDVVNSLKHMPSKQHHRSLTPILCLPIRLRSSRVFKTLTSSEQEAADIKKALQGKPVASIPWLLINSSLQGTLAHEMMSDHNNSGSSLHTTEMSLKKSLHASIPQRQNVVPTAEKTDSSQQGGISLQSFT
ncbi:hypothetical protein Tco_0013732 [Tanacetum coccineum]